MSFHSTIHFNNNGEEYLTITSSPSEYVHEVVVSSIYSLLALLEFSEHRLNNEVIDHLKMRVEQLGS